MKKLRIASVREGDRFAKAVFLYTGQKLFPAGTLITARHLEILKSQDTSEIILADTADEFAQAGVLQRLGNASIQVGKPAGRDTLGFGGSVVLEQGETVEPHHVDAMMRGAFSPSESDGDDSVRLRKDRMQMAEALAEHLLEISPSLERRISPQETEIWESHLSNDDAWPLLPQLTEQRERMVEQLRHLYADIEAGVEVDVAPFHRIVDELWTMLLGHSERFTQLALLVPRRDDYLPDHAICVAVLAMATASRQSWGEPHVRLAGLAGLVYDLGMLLVPQRIRIGGKELTDADRQRVRRHPYYTLSMLEWVHGVDDIVKLAAFQHHERENGSGYPLGLAGDEIADLTRVLAVADVFAALTSPRQYRKNKLPYAAMEQVVRGASSRQFHKPSTRALVEAAGLFPVGSYVKLSSNRLAYVVAANPHHLDRPIVQLLNEHGLPEGLTIDLSRVPLDTLNVARPIADPSQSQMATT